MATLKIRGESYSVIYLYTAADGQKKQQWETYVTELEALQRKTYIEYLQKNVPHLILVEGEAICAAVGSPRALNVALLGAALPAGGERDE